MNIIIIVITRYHNITYYVITTGQLLDCVDAMKRPLLYIFFTFSGLEDYVELLQYSIIYTVT